MDDSLGMGRLQGVHHLLDQRERHLRSERPAPQAVGECLPLQQLHGEEEDLFPLQLGGEQLEDPADVPVGDAPGQQDLATEPLADGRVTGHRGLDELERDPGPEGTVLGLGHDPHSAASDDAQDLEALLEDISRRDGDSGCRSGHGWREGDRPGQVPV
jgi:hypothetical protein